MIQQINQLIEINLSLLYVSADEILHLNDFKDLNYNKLHDARILAEIMQEKKLIRLRLEPERSYELTDFGNQVCEHGGWFVYLDKSNMNIQRSTTHKETKKSIVVDPPSFWKRLSAAFRSK